MKRILLLTFLIFCIVSSAQQNKITFNYDLAGNQISRELCISGCTAKKVKEIKEIEAIVDEDLEKFFPSDVISYYPNPVKEELYLKWDIIDDNRVSSLVIYGSQGQTLKTFMNIESLETLNISFVEYSSGIYIIALNYKNGNQKTIKIIKQ